MSWIQTFTGLRFDMFDPKPEQVCIEDIAHALSCICRFGGHCTVFYSVAQHCVQVSHLVPQNEALYALLHDAAEAYMGDMVAPLKREMQKYKELEIRICAVVLDTLRVPMLHTDNVKIADDTMLATERRDLMVTTDERWRVGNSEPRDKRIHPLPPISAELLFLARYEELK